MAGPLKVVEFVVSLPLPGPLDIGPQVVLEKVNRGLRLISEFILGIADGFTYYPVVGAWRSPSGEIMQEHGLRFSVATPTDPFGFLPANVPGERTVVTRLKNFLVEELGPAWNQQAIYFQVGTEGEILQCATVELPEVLDSDPSQTGLLESPMNVESSAIVVSS